MRTYVPMETAGDPFSARCSVMREIEERSARVSADRLSPQASEPQPFAKIGQQFGFFGIYGLGFARAPKVNV